jgi:hypothetical protein
MANPAKAGDAKPWVYCQLRNDCQAAEEERAFLAREKSTLSSIFSGLIVLEHQAVSFSAGGTPHETNLSPA